MTNHLSKFTALIAVACLVFTSCKKDQTTSTPPQPDVTIVKDNNPVKGTIFVSPYDANDPSTGQIIKLDEHGNTLSVLKTDAQAMNFEKWVINGATRYSYVEHDPSGPHIAGLGYIPGHAVVLDSNLNPIAKYYLLPSMLTKADTNLLDSHDFILLGDGHYIAEAYYVKNVSNIPDSLHPAKQVKVVAPIVQEVLNGEVVWQWTTTDFPEF
jgi:hypothetical protein